MASMQEVTTSSKATEAMSSQAMSALPHGMCNVSATACAHLSTRLRGPSMMLERDCLATMSWTKLLYLPKLEKSDNGIGLKPEKSSNGF